MGAVTDVVKRYVPASYKALVGATNTYDFNISQLQAMANYVQYRLFATVPGSSNESVVWNYNELELIGIMTTIQFIPAAIDYWGNALQSQGTSGTSEDNSYFDRRPDLWRVYEKLVGQSQELSAVVGVNVSAIKAVIPKVSYGDNGRGVLWTQEPTDFPKSFEKVNVDNLIPWSYET